MEKAARARIFEIERNILFPSSSDTMHICGGRLGPSTYIPLFFRLSLSPSVSDSLFFARCTVHASSGSPADWPAIVRNEKAILRRFSLLLCARAPSIVPLHAPPRGKSCALERQNKRVRVGEKASICVCVAVCVYTCVCGCVGAFAQAAASESRCKHVNHIGRNERL